MNLLVVGMGDCRLSDDPAAALITYALGSCIAVAIWDPAVRVGGLLHFMLPEAGQVRAAEADAQPFRYADTGIPLLFRAAYRMGADKRRLVVRLAGGAAVVNSQGLFGIGKQNYAAVQRILRQAGVTVHGEDAGGTLSRTVKMEVGNGRLTVRGPDGAERELAADAGGGRRQFAPAILGGILCASGC